MRVLVMTAIWPTAEHPEFGSFVRSQVKALRDFGIDVGLLVLQGPWRKLIYFQGVPQLRSRLRHQQFDLVHAHYSYVGVDPAGTQWRVPIVLTYHGSDLQVSRILMVATRPPSGSSQPGPEPLPNSLMR